MRDVARLHALITQVLRTAAFLLGRRSAAVWLLLAIARLSDFS